MRQQQKISIIYGTFIFFSLSVLIFTIQQTEAVTEPVCSYRNAQDETIFLKYLPLLRRGEDYVDFGNDGKCLKRARCSDTFKIELEECAKQKITCANKNRFTGPFPACCIKC